MIINDGGGGPRKSRSKKKKPAAKGFGSGVKTSPGWIGSPPKKQPASQARSASRTKAMYSQQDRVGYLIFGPIGGTLAKRANRRFGPGQRRAR